LGASEVGPLSLYPKEFSVETDYQKTDWRKLGDVQMASARAFLREFGAGLEVTPRSPKRDTGVMCICGSVEQLSDLTQKTFQQGEFQ
jgi:hypothetical protein